MEFRILGPLEVVRNGEVLYLGAARLRIVLAALLLNAPRVVPVDRLIEAVWDDEEPTASARTQVQAYVWELRKILGSDLIVTRCPGYLLYAETHKLDALVFAELVEAAKTAAAEDHYQAAKLLRSALALWRGPALADVPSRLIAAQAVQLEERRLSALQDCIGLELAQGEHHGLVAELRALVNDHRLRERFHAQLMLALCRSGRRGEALQAYLRARQILLDELGVEPGPELRELHQAILEDDPRLDLAATRVAAPWRQVPAPPKPAQLPPDIADFAGREHQIAKIAALLTGEGSSEGPRPVVVSAIAGMGGIGKTALAVRVAHRLTQAFPDGQLYVDLGGAQALPLDPALVLDRFLRSLGVEGAAIPKSLDERVALYRSRIAGRKMLVVLDNAATEQQVRPLLPGTGTCGVIVTSRARLAGLEGTHHVDLDVLQPDQAIQVLARIAGGRRVSGEPEAAAEVVRLCGYLPLAVRIAGTRLAAHPHWRLTRLAGQLRDERRRLHELAAGDLAVRASLTLSYAALDEVSKRAFRRLGLLDASDFAPWVAAALLDIPLERAEEQIDALVSAQLLNYAGDDATGQQRFRFHDLVRLYARERAEAEEATVERLAAITRALGAWLALAELADHRLLDRAVTSGRGGAPRWRLPAHITDRLLAAPITWFETERWALLAGVRHAHDVGLDELAWELAGSAANFYDACVHFDDWLLSHEIGLQACQRAGNRMGQAIMLRNLVDLRTYSHASYSHVSYAGDLDADIDTALALFRDLGHSFHEADMLYLRGELLRVRGDLAAALRCFTTALDVAERTENWRAEIMSCCRIGFILNHQGRHEEAAWSAERGLAVAKQHSDENSGQYPLRLLAMIRREQGHLEQAERDFTELLSLSRKMGSRADELQTLIHLGEVYLKSGDAKARSILEQCMAMSRTCGLVLGQATALRLLGDLDRVEGRPDEAIARLTKAIELARGLKDPLAEARSLKSIGLAHDAAGDRDAARNAWHAARDLFERLDIPAEVSELTTLLNGTHPS